jgi:hypothetical protein
VFDHLWQLHARVSRNQLHELSDYVAEFENPRLRLLGMRFLDGNFQIDSGFLKLCQRLLDDPEPAIQLEAAILLAESAIMVNPNEPRLAQILLPAFENKQMRDHWVDLSWYGYQQNPPGGSGGAAMPRSQIPIGVQDQTEALQSRIQTALIRLEPYLTPEQQARFRELNKSQTNLPGR